MYMYIRMYVRTYVPGKQWLDISKTMVGIDQENNGFQKQPCNNHSLKNYIAINLLVQNEALLH